MENDKHPCVHVEKPRKGLFATLVVLIVLLVSALFCSVLYGDEIKALIKSEKTVVTDTVTIDNHVSIEQVLQTRRATKEQLRADSVFMSLSDVVLISVLLKTGTNATIKEIVEEYESYPMLYNGVKLGEKVKQDLTLDSTLIKL